MQPEATTSRNQPTSGTGADGQHLTRGAGAVPPNQAVVPAAITARVKTAA